MAKKILVADDDEDVVILLKTALEIRGFNVITASNGTEALAKALREKPDLILLDIIMPGLAGYQVFEKLQSDPHTQKAPVIVISGRKSMEAFFPSSELITFVSKPFDVNVLLVMVDRLLALQTRGESKDVLILGVQDFVVNKIKAWFEKKGYKVTTLLNEYEAIQKCEKLAPKFFFCEFWEDPGVLDSVTVYKKVHHGLVGDKIHFYIYCHRNLLIEARQTFPHHAILPYTDSKELLQEIEKNIVR